MSLKIYCFLNLNISNYKIQIIIKYLYLINQYAHALLSGHPDASTSAILFP
jgi:hypothetical protein